MYPRGVFAAAILVMLGISPAASGAAVAGEGIEVVPGELIVRFEPGVGAAKASRTLTEAGAESEQRLPVAGTRLADTDRGRAATAETIAELERDPDVVYAEPNFVRRLDALPDDPFLDELWGFENAGDTDIDAAAGWDVTTTSRDLEVAVVDDGISYAHPDLAANIWANPGEAGDLSTNGIDDDGNGYVDDARGWDFADGDADPAPVGADGDHGTHVAGTVGAVGDNGTGVTGVAWRTRLMALRVFDEAGVTTTAKIVAAFRYAARSGADVVNGSFGGGGFSRAELDAIEAAPDSLFVVAAGNESSDNDAVASYPCRYGAENLTCVAATDRDDELAGFSNYGAASVDLAAPGVDILSTYPEDLTPDGYLPYAWMSGTSMATPIVSGAAALVYAERPDATGAGIAADLRRSVDPVPALSGRVATGGRLNLATALSGRPPQPEPALEPAPQPVPPIGPQPEPEPDQAPAPEEPEPEPAPVDEIDATSPETRIRSGPARRTRDRTPVFRFASSEEASGFRCRLDRRRPKPCSSPYRPGRVGRGRHVFKVFAIDWSGNEDPSPAKRRFRIRR